jgi:hypothetical protein
VEDLVRVGELPRPVAEAAHHLLATVTPAPEE